MLAVDALGTGDLDRLVAGWSDPAPFETLRLTTGEALDQYLRIYLRLPIGPRRLGPLARIFDYVSAAAPGVREILVIGKIGWEVRSAAWDEIVVDGPATGHVVELLDAPRTMAELVPSGPLAEQTGWLRAILASPATGVTVVSSPDELSVSETGELVDRLVADTETDVELLVANRLPPTLEPAGLREAADRAVGDGPMAGLAALALDRHRVTETGLERLRAIRAGAEAPLPVATVDDDPTDPVGAVMAGLAALAADRSTGRDGG